MPASSTKKRPPMEMEAGTDEIREGEDDKEMPFAKGKSSRKRSAKGAKQTKAPVDGGMYGKKPMDGEGCGCGKRKAKCDGSCGKKMDRNDALTPQEYLAACDLGVQKRVRSYIRARLDAAERLDKKCGASGIADNKKCRIGTGGSAAQGGSMEQQALTASKSVKGPGIGRALLGVAAVAGAAGVGAKLAQAAMEDNKRKEHNKRVKAKRPGNSVRQGARAYLGLGASIVTGNKQILKNANNDSVWADGFSAAERIDKKCGASGIADNKKCRIGSGGAPGQGGSMEQRALAASKSVKSNNVLGTLAAAGLIGGAIGVANHIQTQERKGKEAKGVIKKIKDIKFKANSGVTAAALAAKNGVEFSRTAKNPLLSGPAAEQRAIAQGMARIGEAQQTRAAVYGMAKQTLRELGETVPASPARRRRASAARRARSAPGGALATRDTYADGFSVDTASLTV